MDAEVDRDAEITEAELYDFLVTLSKQWTIYQIFVIVGVWWYSDFREIVTLVSFR